MFYLIGTTISFFLCLILFSKKDNNQADKILAAWLLFTGIHLLLYYLFITGQYEHFPFLLGLDLPMPLIHGPVLFLYVSALTRTEPLPKTSLYHFVPFLLALLSLIPFFISSNEEKIMTYKNEGAGYELLLSILYSGILISGVTYSFLSLQKLYRHQKNIGELFSSTEKINLSWLRYLIVGSALIWLVVIFGEDAHVYTTITLYVLFIGYFGIKQVGIFTNLNLQTSHREMTSLPAMEFIVDNPAPEKVKYEKSGLATEHIEKIHQQLVQLMHAEKLFTNPELTLADLAQQLEIHPNTLSQVINTKEQKNFFDYVNGHRVDAFKERVSLPENQKYTLLSLAFDCGFNSKTSFNRNFKKATGFSPSEYLKQIDVRLE